MPLSPNLRGILLMTLSMALFAVEDLFLKLSAQSLPTGEILLLTTALGLLFFGGLTKARRQSLTKGLWHPAVVARNAGEMVGTFAYMTALASVPLATVSSVLQALPLAVTLGAALFFGQRVAPWRWFAIAAGFAGVLLVIRPGLEGFRPAAAWVLVTVAGLALRDLASRNIPKDISTEQVSAWGVGSVLVLSLGMLPFQDFVTPDLAQTASLLAAFVFGTGGYWAVIEATRSGDVARIAPFRYSRLLFALVIGAVFFAETPDLVTLLGAGLIVASGILTLILRR
ncbi:DMT family transporter [Stagnihabitans tardus]|uniref:EamA family transporter n=1 Tax=Stagnihabitans tardus TaxID=2699202 RepID=A0AAE4Y5U4_9RHOB|nr:DMT family transporter [Stagnihabitans tardus]NBZ86308.1 EamA family transporter [Stagnihabitans tardus]